MPRDGEREPRFGAMGRAVKVRNGSGRSRRAGREEQPGWGEGQRWRTSGISALPRVRSGTRQSMGWIGS